jgi:predicted MFS family arabinose efflux permease
MAELSERPTAAPDAPVLSGAVATGKPTTGRMVYGTVLLAMVWMLAEADRNILAVLLTPIQKDLGVSDTAMGALTGIAFAAVYATVMLPMSRVADRGNRRNVIAAALAIWSAMTVFSGMATTYVTMLFARMGVAAAEASAMPRRRATAMGAIMSGTAVGIGLGAFIAGKLADTYSWHVAFFVLGTPGLLLAVLFFFTVPEPPRGAHEGGDRHDPESASLWTSLRYLVRVPTVPPFLLARILLQMSTFAYMAWIPTYLIRIHGMSTTTMSMWFGISAGAGAVFGTVLSGMLSDYLIQRGPRWRMYFLGGVLLLATPLLAVVVLSDNTPLVIAFMIAYSFVGAGAAGVSMAAGIEIVRPRMRGIMTAAIGLCTSVIGAGGGPLLIGAVSDALKATYGEDALRYSMYMLPVMGFLAAMIFLWASRTADRDALAARGEAPTS